MIHYNEHEKHQDIISTLIFKQNKKTPLHSFTNCSDSLQDKTDNQQKKVQTKSSYPKQ